MVTKKRNRQAHGHPQGPPLSDDNIYITHTQVDPTPECWKYNEDFSHAGAGSLSWWQLDFLIIFCYFLWFLKGLVFPRSKVWLWRDLTDLMADGVCDPAFCVLGFRVFLQFVFWLFMVFFLTFVLVLYFYVLHRLGHVSSCPSECLCVSASSFSRFLFYLASFLFCACCL